MLQDAIDPTSVERVIVEVQRRSIPYVKFWPMGKPLRPVNGFRDQFLAGVDTNYPSTGLGQDRLGVVAKTASNIQNRNTPLDSLSMSMLLRFITVSSLDAVSR